MRAQQRDRTVPGRAAAAQPFSILLLDRTDILMRTKIAIVFLLFAGLASAVIVDRIAVVVGNRVIRAREIDRALRLTAFLNGEQPDLGPATMKQTAERLVDQELIRTAIVAGRYPGASQADASKLLGQIRRERYPGGAQ